jgi:RHS repeat-associated protein
MQEGRAGARGIGLEDQEEAVQGRGYRTKYRYDLDGDLDTLVYPSGLTIKLTRDPATKEVTEVKDVTTGVKYASSVTHWPAGPLKGLTYSNGTTLSQTFNLRYDPLTIASGPVSLTLTPAKAGGFTAIQVGTAVTTYGRDFLDHLVSSNASTGATSYTYRYTGDRIKEAWTVEATPKRKYAFGYDDQTNLSAISVYDSAGTTLSSTTCLVHDGLNRLVAVGPAKVLAGPDATACRLESDLSTVQVRFQYDAQHRRSARQDGTGAWKQYVMAADGDPLSELTRPTTSGGAWSPVRDYVWVDGKPLVQLEYPGPQVYAVHSDHLGLPRALTGATAATVWSAATRPYGDLVETTSTGVVTNLRLPGQYHERGTSPTDAGLLSSIGLQGPYYNWNRWYLPMAGRYMELDPIALSGGLNAASRPDWFSYVEGQPLSNTDPQGLCIDACVLEAAAVAGVMALTTWATGAQRTRHARGTLAPSQPSASPHPLSQNQSHSPCQCLRHRRKGLATQST